MRQLTLRAIPGDIDRLLRENSRKTGKSINKTAIAVLKKGLGISESPKKKRSISHLAGTWTTQEADEFAKNTAMFEAIDREVWEK